MGGWMGPRAGLEAVVKRNVPSLPLPRIEARSFNPCSSILSENSKLCRSKSTDEYFSVVYVREARYPSAIFHVT
jgi:hypothetical protein